MFITRFLFALALIVAAFAQEVEEGVLVLTDANFDQVLSDNEFVLVEFYAPWCGHCKTLAPEYAKAATKLAEDGSEVKLAKMDATEHKVAAGKHDVKGFPTLKFFRSGSGSEYGGGRTGDEIVSWLSKKTGPVATPIGSAEELTHMQEANDVFVLGVVSDEASESAKNFLQTASSMESFTFGITTSEEVKASLGIKEDTVVIIKTFDELRNDHAITTASEMEVFISGHGVPLVQIFSEETSGNIFKSPIQKHTLFFTDSKADHHEPTMEAFRIAGKEFRGETMMINVPESQNRVMEYFGLTAADLPAAVFADMGSAGGMKKFPFSGSVQDSENIKSFLKDALAGKITPTLKSEEPSPEDTAGGVTVVKGKSFRELVIDNTKDVLMEFYAPWCGHCKSLQPDYDAVGELFKGNDNIVIAKMDATANEIDIEGVNVKGFPTLMFFKGNDKGTPIKYEDGRTKDDFIAYIKKNAFNAIGELAEVEADADEDDEDDENDEL